MESKKKQEVLELDDYGGRIIVKIADHSKSCLIVDGKLGIVGVNGFAPINFKKEKVDKSVLS